MPQFFDHIPDNLRDWAHAQQVFFIASAPLAGKHVNISPKGLPLSTFTVFDKNHCGYIDATGSGAETISHLYENGRATIMFCSFELNPRIMRFFCTGRVIEYDHPEFEHWLSKMDKASVRGARAVLLFDVFKVQTACGYAVPMLSEVSDGETMSRLNDRKTLGHWAGQTIEKGKMDEYRIKNNARSLDNLGGLVAARRNKGETIWLADIQIMLQRFFRQWDAVLFGAVLVLLAIALLNSVPSTQRVFHFRDVKLDISWK